MGDKERLVSFLVQKGILIGYLIICLFLHGCGAKEKDKVELKTFSRSIFIDPRDNQKYTIITFDSISWFTQNLNFDTLSYISSYCSNEDSCRTNGRMYFSSIANLVCPKGWHLPSDKEWQILEKAMGLQANEVESIGIMRGINSAKKFKQLFNIKPECSIVWMDGVFSIKKNNKAAGYWTSTINQKKDSIWIRIFYPELNIGRFKTSLTNDSSLFCIRCIRD